MESATMSTLGRILSFRIGAVVSWGIGTSLAKITIEGLDLALGPASEAFDSPQVIDVEALGDEPASYAYAHLELPTGDEGERRWIDQQPGRMNADHQKSEERAPSTWE